MSILIYNVPVVIVTVVTGLEKINFHSNPRSAILENVQATIHLHSFHMLARLCLDSFNLGFSNTWTKSFRMYKLGFKEAEEPETKLPTIVTSWRKQRRSRKAFTSASLTMLKPLSVWFSNWKIFKDMGVPDHLTCLLRNLFVGQEATVRIGHGTTDWFQIGKGVHQDCVLSPCLFNFFVKYIMWKIGLDESQVGIKISGRNIHKLRYDTTLMKVKRI